MQDPDVEPAIFSVLARGDASPPWQLLGRLLSGGQRIRPRLVVALAGADGESTSLLRDAAAIELVHLSTLIHDDIIDHSDTRRGVPTLNAACGTEVALLIGNIVKDHALTLATEGAVPILNDASLDVNQGQLRETLARGRILRFEELFAVQLYKTARAFRHCARLAAIHRRVGLGEEIRLAAELSALAFQAVDDWLDLAPAGHHTGKDGGRDRANAVPSFVHADGAGVRSTDEPAVAEAVAIVQAMGWDQPLHTRGPEGARTAVLDFCAAMAARCQSLCEHSDAALVFARLHDRVRERALAVRVEPSFPPA